MKLFSAFCILSLMILSSCKTTKVVELEEQDELLSSKYSFDFIKKESLLDIVDKAENENKLVFLDIYTDWCLPCKVMDDEVFTNENLGEFFNENFISYKVDAEKNNGPDINELYNIDAYPTLLFLDTKGRVLERKKGLTFSKDLKELALKSIEKNQMNNSTE